VNGSRSFTLTHKGNVRVLVTDVRLAPAFDPQSPPPHPQYKKFRAIWDTGATGTVISQRIVNECGLQQTGVTKVFHAQGAKENVPVYLVNVGLPNSVAFSGVPVTLGELANGDALIGMDIIGNGDFAVTNHNKETVMSYRVPSTEHIDFVKAAKQPVLAPPKVGRNDKCPCGSGKKYKKCCMAKDTQGGPSGVGTI
jgi:predicted aspartyl protease